MATTFEEAKQCPRCGKVGEDVKTSTQHDRRGNLVTVHYIYCRNILCIWLDTAWVIQVNADGSIPEPSAFRGKQFPTISDESKTRIEEALAAQLKAETGKGAEIRNPYS